MLLPQLSALWLFGWVDGIWTGSDAHPVQEYSLLASDLLPPSPPMCVVACGETQKRGQRLQWPLIEVIISWGREAVGWWSFLWWTDKHREASWPNVLLSHSGLILMLMLYTTIPLLGVKITSLRPLNYGSFYPAISDILRLERKRDSRHLLFPCSTTLFSTKSRFQKESNWVKDKKFLEGVRVRGIFWQTAKLANNKVYCIILCRIKPVA